MQNFLNDLMQVLIDGQNWLWLIQVWELWLKKYAETTHVIINDLW